MNKVFTFHDIRSEIWFEKTLNILKNKFDFISIKNLEEFYYSGKALNNTCHLTVDDGDKTFYNIIYPVLKRMNVPATIFVSPKICSDPSNFWFQEIRGFDREKMLEILAEDYKFDLRILQQYSIMVIFKNMKINQIWDVISKYRSYHNVPLKESQNMSVAELKKVDREGLVAIGAHTMNHPILFNENEEFSNKEIVDSIKILENILGHSVKYFAYPNGTPQLDFSNREIKTLINSNCHLAFSTETKNIDSSNNPLSIPRYGLSLGNKFFIRTKILLGENWNRIKHISSKDEIRLRIELKEKIKF